MDSLLLNYQKAKQQKAWMIDQAAKSMLDKNKIKSTEKWSINQLIFHLYNVEKSVLGYIKHKHQKGELNQKVGLKARIRYFSLKMLLMTKMKFKAPKVLEQNPEVLDFDELLTNWTTTQKEFEEFLKNFPKDIIKLNIFPIEKSYFIRLGTFLEFLKEKIIPKIESSNIPLINIDTTTETNICYVIDNVISLDIRKCIINNNNFPTFS